MKTQQTLRSLVLATALLAPMMTTASAAGDGQVVDIPKIEGLPKITEKDFSKAVHKSFYVSNPHQWKRFFDKTLEICNATDSQPSAAQAQDILNREQKSIVYPKDGKLMGDWKAGEKWAEGVHGGRIGYPGFHDADDPSKPNEANCYACHAMSPAFPQAGNIGPSLTDYGKLRGASEAVVKYTYDKIYNSKSLNPCSLMPRYGGPKHLLTPEQVADLTAYLLDPESPVNNGGNKTAGAK